MRTLTSWIGRVLLSTFALSAIGGCDSEETTDESMQLVADVDGQIFLGIVADDEKVVAYACDGTPESVQVRSWYAGTNDDGAFTIDGPNGSVLHGTLDHDRATGTLTVDGVDHPFTAHAATGDEGTYHALTDDLKASWVVVGADSRGAVITRTTGDLITGARFESTGITVNAVVLTPVRLTSPADFQG